MSSLIDDRLINEDEMLTKYYFFVKVSLGIRFLGSFTFIATVPKKRDKGEKSMKLNINFLVAILGTLIITTVSKVAYLPMTNLGIIIAFLVSYPWKIGKNVYSLFGGHNPSGDVYSLLGLYQNAGGHAFQVFGLSFYQKAGGSAIQIAGFSFLQQSEGWTAQGIGFLVFQFATANAIQLVGIGLYQEAQGSTEHGLGIMLAQEARVNALQLIGLSIEQKARNDAANGVGIVVCQTAGRNAEQFVGLSILQFAMKNAFQLFGLTLIRRGKTFEGYGIAIVTHPRE